MKEFRKKNHYIARSYLKAWCNTRSKVYVYYILVPTVKMKLWVERTTKAIGYQEHLFTSTVTGQESDNIEKWMAEEIEEPAQKALNKLRNNENLSTHEWSLFLRFVALHDTRTPQRYIQSLHRMREEVPIILEKTLKETLAGLNSQKGLSGMTLQNQPSTKNALPLSLTTEVDHITNTSYLKANTVVGRSMWLTSLQHVLESTYLVLMQHKWNVVSVPEGFEWVTSDNPVVKLNYNSIVDFDLNGGWNSPGTEIMFPLSPQYLLYTKVGEEVSINQCTVDLAKKLLFFIAKNSYRQIYASKPLDIVVTLRTREVDLAKYNAEKEAWENLHKDQKAAETNLFEGD